MPMLDVTLRYIHILSLIPATTLEDSLLLLLSCILVIVAMHA